MKQLNFELNPDILPITIFVSYGESPAEAQEYFHKYTDKRMLIENWHQGVTWYDEISDSRKGWKAFLYIKADNKRAAPALAGLVAHEATHISYILSQCAGDIFNPQIQEPQCYFIQYLVESICDRIWAHVTKKRNKS